MAVVTDGADGSTDDEDLAPEQLVTPPYVLSPEGQAQVDDWNAQLQDESTSSGDA